MIRYVLIILFLANAIHASSQGEWQEIPNAPSSGRYDDISFINDSTGFVAGTNKVLETIDKGNTWNLICNSIGNINYIRSIEFFNDSIGFIGLLATGSLLVFGNLLKTTNGGLSWTLLQNMNVDTFDGICGMAHFGNTLCAVGTWSGPAWFYRTDDLGQTWQKKDMSAYASGLVDCYMMNRDTILVSGIADSSSDLKATILKSYDGGTTWQRVYLGDYPTSYCWKLFFRPNGLGLGSVEFGNSTIARTNDFGNTWTSLPVAVPDSNDLGGIGLLNDTLGWIMDQHDFGTWETHDGGLTWKAVNSPVLEGDRMVVLDSTTALISGATIYKYVYGDITAVPPIPAVNKRIHQLIVSPNPASNQLSVEAIAGSNTFGILDILDEKGSMVKHITRQPFIKGKTSFTVDIKNLSAGNYQILWRTNELFLSKGFEVVK